MSEEERPDSEASDSLYEDAMSLNMDAEDEQFLEALEQFLDENYNIESVATRRPSNHSLSLEAHGNQVFDLNPEEPSTSASCFGPTNRASCGEGSPQPGTSHSDHTTGFHDNSESVTRPTEDVSDSLPGDDDDVILLDINQADLESIDRDLNLDIQSTSHHDDDNNQVAMVSVGSNAQAASSNEQPRDSQNEVDEPENGSGSSHGNDVNRDANAEEHHHDNRGDAREGNAVEMQDAAEMNGEEAEDRMLDALVNMVTNRGEALSFENLLEAVNAQNMDNYLSVWHVQHQQEHHHDNREAWQVAGEEQNDAEAAASPWRLVDDRENIGNEQAVAMGPGMDDIRNVQFRDHHDNEDNNLLVVIQNNLHDVIDHHDDVVVDIDEDANRRVIVRENYDIPGNNDVILDNADEAFDHHGNQEVFDLRELLNREGAVIVPRLDLGLDMDAAFDADAEDSNDGLQIVGHVIEVGNNDPAGVVAMAAAAVPVAMEQDNDVSSASSTASTSPRRRERRRKRKKPVEDRYVAPPGDDTVGLKWANDLPEIVLLQIYGLMRDADRFSMSRVCHYWSDIFCSARLWRERCYRFAGVYTNIKLGDRAIGFAKKHSSHLKVLTITCEHPTYLSVKRFQRTMTTFFNLLLRRHSPCRLHELYITSLAIERYWRYECTRHKFLVSLSRFLGSQNKLKAFDMSEGLFTAADGFRVIEALGRGAKNSLVLLNIEDFFQARLSLVSSDRWVELLTRFRRLTSVYLNYNWLSETLLLALSQSTQGRLKLLSVKVLKNDPHHHKIDGVTWHTVRKQCPLLRVHLYTEGLGSHGDFRNLLVPEMPLRSLQVWTGLHRNQEGPWHLPHTFSFLGDCFSNQLEELSVCCENDSEFIDDSVLYLLQKATRLQYLDLQAVLLTNIVENICKLQQQHKIGLQRCHLILENLTGIDVQELEYIVERYEPMINERKLDFNFQPNQLPFF